MNHSRYEYEAEDELFFYEFTSEGSKGSIKKLVEYSKTSVENVYNLAFGDYDELKGGIDDKSITNNGESQKVLATVASIIYDFTNIYTKAAVFIQGSTAARTRRYQMGINKYWDQISPIFEVIGLKNDSWESFRKGENYNAFIGRRKASFLF